MDSIVPRALWVALACAACAPASSTPVPLDGSTARPDAGAVRDVPSGVDVPAVPQDAMPAVDVPAVPLDAPPPGDALPAFTPQVTAYVRMQRTAGMARGNRPNVFAKIGDSITESGSFLFDCGSGSADLQSYADLQGTIDYFSQVTFPDPDPTAGATNSFNRHSLCAMGGWDSSQAVTPYMGEATTRLVQELDAIHPAYALVEYGTNDVLENSDQWSVAGAHPEATLATNLATIVSLIQQRGVVPVLYTIPPLVSVAESPQPPAVLHGVQVVNGVIRSLAASQNLPLVDFWVALEHVPPTYGIDTDGIHPNALHGSDACIFTAEGLTYGYNIRNLLTLQMLARLRSL